MAGIPDLLPWLDAQKRGALRTLQDALAEAQEDPSGTAYAALRQMFGRAPLQMADLAVAGVPGGQMGTLADTLLPPTGKAAEKVAEVTPTPGAGTAAGIKALVGKIAPAAAAAWGAMELARPGGKAVPLAQAGALRPGGRPDLLLTQGGKKLGFDYDTGKLPTELYSPSLAITGQSNVIPFYDPSTGTLAIPRVGAFDPKENWATLWNRDAYAKRKGDYEGYDITRDILAGYNTDRASKELAALRRARDRELTKTPQHVELGEGGKYTLDPAHEMAVREGRDFKSFEHYERSPMGAMTLDVGGSPTRATTEWQRDFEEWAKALGKHPADYGGTRWKYKQIRDALIEATKARDPAADELLARIRIAPSSYAELKVHGPVGIHGGNFAGAMVTDARGQLADALRARGIKVHGMRGDELVDEQRDIAQWLQGEGPKPVFQSVQHMPTKAWESLDFAQHLKNVQPNSSFMFKGESFLAMPDGKVFAVPQGADPMKHVADLPFDMNAKAAPAAPKFNADSPFKFSASWSQKEGLTGLPKGQTVTLEGDTFYKDMNEQLWVQDSKGEYTKVTHLGGQPLEAAMKVSVPPAPKMTNLISHPKADVTEVKLLAGGKYHTLNQNAPLAKEAKKVLSAFHYGAAENTIFTFGNGKKYHVDPTTGTIIDY